MKTFEFRVDDALGTWGIMSVEALTEAGARCQGERRLRGDIGFDGLLPGYRLELVREVNSG